MTSDFPKPSTDYEKLKPATERKCEFNFLQSNGMLPQKPYKVMDKTENAVSYYYIVIIILYYHYKHNI